MRDTSCYSSECIFPLTLLIVWAAGANNGNQVLLTLVLDWSGLKQQRYTPMHWPRYSSSTILFAKQLMLSRALGLGYVWPSEPHTGSRLAVIAMGHTHSALPPTTLHWWYGCVHSAGSAQGSVNKGKVITLRNQHTDENQLARMFWLLGKCLLCPHPHSYYAKE